MTAKYSQKSLLSLVFCFASCSASGANVADGSGGALPMTSKLPSVVKCCALPLYELHLLESEDKGE